LIDVLAGDIFGGILNYQNFKVAVISTFGMHAFDFTLFDYFTQTTALCMIVMHSVGNDIAWRGRTGRPIINRAAVS